MMELAQVALVLINNGPKTQEEYRDPQSVYAETVRLPFVLKSERWPNREKGRVWRLTLLVPAFERLRQEDH